MVNRVSFMGPSSFLREVLATASIRQIMTGLPNNFNDIVDGCAVYQCKRAIPTIQGQYPIIPSLSHRAIFSVYSYRIRVLGAVCDRGTLSDDLLEKGRPRKHYLP